MARSITLTNTQYSVITNIMLSIQGVTRNKLSKMRSLLAIVCPILISLTIVWVVSASSLSGKSSTWSLNASQPSFCLRSYCFISQLQSAMHIISLPTINSPHKVMPPKKLAVKKQVCEQTQAEATTLAYNQQALTTLADTNLAVDSIRQTAKNNNESYKSFDSQVNAQYKTYNTKISQLYNNYLAALGSCKTQTPPPTMFAMFNP